MVRWVPDAFFGYGYPVFNFYPPLFYILGALVADFGSGVVFLQIPSNIAQAVYSIFRIIFSGFGFNA